MGTMAFWRSRLIELAVALLVVMAIIQLSGEVSERQKSLVPAASWFKVNEIYVPDHPSGSNPEVIYDRSILENFDGFWIVEAQRQTQAGLWSTECSGSGVNEYDPSEVIEDNTVTWQWLIGKPCAVRPGVYRLKATYTMTRPGWPQKRLFATSNPFVVSESE